MAESIATPIGWPRDGDLAQPRLLGEPLGWRVRQPRTRFDRRRDATCLTSSGEHKPWRGRARLGARGAGCRVAVASRRDRLQRVATTLAGDQRLADAFPDCGNPLPDSRKGGSDQAKRGFLPARRGPRARLILAGGQCSSSSRSRSRAEPAVQSLSRSDGSSGRSARPSRRRRGRRRRTPCRSPTS